MGRAAGVSRRRKKNKNPRFKRKATLQKHKAKLTAHSAKVVDATMRKNWDLHKTTAVNLTEMGLAVDPNKTIGIPKTAEELGFELPKEGYEDKLSKIPKIKAHVVKQLEEDANKPLPKNFKFGVEVIKFLVYLMEKYGEDYDAMSRDPKNYYQDSPGQIREKIKKMKKIPRNWNAYIKAQELAMAPMDE